MIETGPDCLVCFMKQAKGAIALCEHDPDKQFRLLAGVAKMISRFPTTASPPENAAHYYQFIREHTGVRDPFCTVKQKSTDHLLAQKESLCAVIKAAADPILTAARLAVGANVLDSGAQHQLDITEALQRCLHTPFAVSHYQAFSGQLRSLPKILYLADNCGELVLDKMLVQLLIDMGCRVTVALRQTPVINDATLEDACTIGLDQLCPLITNGTGIPGTVLGKCSREFREHFEAAELIISKGMGNFESLYGTGAPLYYLFTVKCTTVRTRLREEFSDKNIDIGSFMFLREQAFREGCAP